jgi:hypothetical protein
MDFDALKVAIGSQVLIGSHGREGLRKHGLTIDVVRASVRANGEMIEDYPNDPRGPSCLILCTLPDGSLAHTVWGWRGSGEPFLITAYRPRPDRWLPDGHTRR